MNTDEMYRDNSVTRRKISAIFSREEIQRLTRRSDARGALAIASAWGAITATFAVMAWSMSKPLWVSIPVCVAGVALIGGRQVGLAILTHEATHKTLFNNKMVNDIAADWLCGRPVGLDLYKYRAHHFIHHTKTGTAEDSDISLIRNLPTTRASLLRKFGRDLVGITGGKFLVGRVLMDAELIKWTVATDVVWLPKDDRGYLDYAKAILRNAGPTILTNVALFAALWAVGYPWLYLAWVVAYLIPYPLFLRVRALAEHAATEMTSDMFKNTRTTKAGCLARMLFAPFNVNYHIEHHALASVPFYRLPQVHTMLRARGIVDAPPDYLDVLKLVSSAEQTHPQTP